jgi:MFS family permease
LDHLQLVTPPDDSPGQLYNRTFVIAVLSQTGFVLGNTLMVHYARWIEYLEGGIEQVGLIMGFGAITAVIGRPWLGQLINSLGARTTWAIGYLLFIVGAFLNLLIPDQLLRHDPGSILYLLRALMTLGAAFVFTSSLAYVTNAAPAERRTESIGILGVGGFVGMLLGPVIGDWILGSGTDRLRGDFTTFFLVSGGALIIPLLLLAFLPAQQGRTASAGGLRRFFASVWQYFPGTILVVNCAFGLCMTVPFIFLAKFVDDEHLVLENLSIIGVFFWAYAGWGLTVRVALRRVPDQLGRRRVLLAGMLLMGIGMFCFLPIDASRPAWIILPALLCGTGHALMFHCMMALTVEPFPDELRGTGSSLALMSLDLGLVAGSPILAMVVAWQGSYDALFVTVGSTVLVVGVLYTLVSIPVWRERARRKELDT